MNGQEQEPQSLEEARALVRALRAKLAEQPEAGEHRSTYDALFVHAGQAALLVDPDSIRIADANEAACALYGYDRKSLCSMTFDNLCSPGQPGLSAALGEAELEGRRTLRFWQIKAEGAAFHAEVRCAWVEPRGEPRWHCVINDVSAVETANAALRESEERFRYLADAAPVLIRMTGQLGQSCYFNQPWLKFLGISLDEAVEQDFLEWIHPNDRDAFSRQVIHRLGAPRRVQLEYRCRDHGGEYRWLLDTHAPRYLSSTDFAGYVSVAVDITERRMAEAELRRNRDNLDARVHQRTAELAREHKAQAALLESIPCAAYLVDKVGRVIHGNPGFAEMLGLHPHEVESLDMGAPAASGLVRRLHHADQEVFQSGRPSLNREEEWPLEDGEYRCFLVNRVPYLDDEGSIAGLAALYLDISDRKRSLQAQRRLEEQMLQAQKTESLGDLAAGIAHDFNNLLMAISGNAELAMMETGEDTQLARFIGEIQGAAVRAASLAKQMLAYSGRGPFVLRETNLSDRVLGMRHLLESSTGGKALLLFNCPDDLPAIAADHDQLGQVILNLVTNAAEAMNTHSGMLLVSTNAVYCDRESFKEAYLAEKLPEGMYVCLDVVDSGAGMDEETRRRVFDPFFTTKFLGRGLGLAAVQGIVRAHKGALVVLSEPGVGTMFRLLFPAVEKAGKPIRQTPGAPLRHKKGTVLIVEDEASLRSMTGMMLKRLGYSVLTACDGVEGIRLFRERVEELQCVLLDLTMPNLDGRETLIEMRAICPSVPIILCSGYSKQEMSQGLGPIQPDGYLQKPYRGKALAAAIEALAEADGG